MSDKPFVLRGGDDEQTAIHNRIAAIERIKYLTGVDLRHRTAIYLQAFDLEMWKRWYKDEPVDKKIDEEWCQRAAEVVKGMEGKDITVNVDELNTAYLEHHAKLKDKEKKDDRKHVESSPQDAGQTQQDAS